jgi:hypothetical protein
VSLVDGNGLPEPPRVSKLAKTVSKYAKSALEGAKRMAVCE